ncbi:putative transporter small subunit [Streptomyces sp. AJS327]|uniref:putative transporter small subunit n=1 Tax=Streptomyces sp. AJS327 TaxID=2545265 RepID=UPI001C609E05|nr:putative transporter small subunit [Streptomyces sp. AJS327]
MTVLPRPTLCLARAATRTRAIPEAVAGTVTVPPNPPEASDPPGGIVSSAALTAYVLMWPAIVAVVLFVISRGFFREWAEARRQGRRMI